MPKVGWLQRTPLPTRFFEHPLSQPEDQPRVFGDIDELGGEQKPARGMMPTNQGLHADDRAGHHVDGRLPVELELTSFDSVVELDSQPRAVRNLFLQLELEESEAILAL
jgi:hypothetical protein